jgi:hypothetical protein
VATSISGAGSYRQQDTGEQQCSGVHALRRLLLT